MAVRILEGDPLRDEEVSRGSQGEGLELTECPSPSRDILLQPELRGQLGGGTQQPTVEGEIVVRDLGKPGLGPVIVDLG